MSQEEIVKILKKDPFREWTIKELREEYVDEIHSVNLSRAIIKLEKQGIVKSRLVRTRIKKVRLLNGIQNKNK